MAVAPDGSVFSADFAGVVFKSTDANGDGDFDDPGEVVEACDTGSEIWGMLAGPDSLMVNGSDVYGGPAAGILDLRDLNSDGDMGDPDESTLWSADFVRAGHTSALQFGPSRD